jgi:voltage-gated potassium channel
MFSAHNLGVEDEIVDITERRIRAKEKRTRLRRKLFTFAVAFVAILAFGTVGYLVIEGWSLLESIYMTVITLSTVGFSEVRPLSPAGQGFTAALIIAGVGAVTYLFASISQHIVSGELTGSLRKARMQQRIDALSGHYIVCGCGRVGRQVVEDLHGEHKPCVVIDSQEELLHGLPVDVATVLGDASDDDVLDVAGISRAAGLVAATGDDAINLFVTLTARTLNPDLVIVARANQSTTEPKLLRAGASHVLSPHTISGRRIARLLLHPSIIDFLEVVMHSGKLELVLEECRVQQGSDLHGKTVAEADVRKRTGANVLAVKRQDQGAILTNPPSEMQFEPGEIIIALGTHEQLQALARLAGED